MRRIKPKKSPLSIKAKIRLALWGIILLGCVSFAVSPCGRATWGWIRNGYLTLAQKAHLVLDQVQVEGHARTQIKDINTALNITQGTPIFDLDLKDLKDRIMALPWIKTATIERHLPATLFIRVTEKEPIALWQNNQKYLPLDESGHPIKDSQTPLPPLLLVVGSDAPTHTLDLIQALSAYPKIQEKVRSAVRVGNRRWNLVLNEVDGLIVKLPESHISEALSRLSDQIETGLLKKDLASIDMRHPDRLIVTLKGGKK